MEFHQNLQTHSYDCYPAGGGGGGGGGSKKHCLLPLFSFFSHMQKASFLMTQVTLCKVKIWGLFCTMILS